MFWGPRTIGYSFARGVTKRFNSKDEPQTRLIGKVTISFTKLLTVPSISDSGRELTDLVDNSWRVTKNGSMKESDKPKSTRALTEPGNAAKLNSR